MISDSVTLFESFAQRKTEWDPSKISIDGEMYLSGYYLLPVPDSIVPESIIVYQEATKFTDLNSKSRISDNSANGSGPGATSGSANIGRTMLDHQYIPWNPTNITDLKKAKKLVSVEYTDEDRQMKSIEGQILNYTQEYVELYVPPPDNDGQEYPNEHTNEQPSRVIIRNYKTIRYFDNSPSFSYVKLKLPEKSRGKVTINYLLNDLYWKSRYDFIIDFNNLTFPLIRYHGQIYNSTGNAIKTSKTTVVAGEQPGIDDFSSKIGDYVKYGLGELKLTETLPIEIFTAANINFKKIYMTNIELSLERDDNVIKNSPVKSGYRFDAQTIFEDENLPKIFPKAPIRFYSVGSRGELVGTYIGTSVMDENYVNETNTDIDIELGSSNVQSVIIDTKAEYQEDDNAEPRTPIVGERKKSTRRRYLNVRSTIKNKSPEDINLVIKYGIDTSLIVESKPEISSSVEIAETAKNNMIEFEFMINKSDEVDFGVTFLLT